MTGYYRGVGPHHPHWYIYKNEYGPMLITEETFKIIDSFHDMPPGVKMDYVDMSEGVPRQLAQVYIKKGGVLEAQKQLNREGRRELDILEFEKTPKSLERLTALFQEQQDKKANSLDVSWYEMRTGKKPPRDTLRIKAFREDVFLVSYLSSRLVTHPPIITRFHLPDGHYDQDEFIKIINRSINDEIYDVFKTVNAAQKLLDQKDQYFTIYVMKESITEEPTAECPFKPTTVTEKHFVQMSMSGLLDDVSLALKFTTPMQFILGMSPSSNIDVGKHVCTIKPSRVPHVIDVYRNPISTLWVFCDIVKPTYIKNITAPLLRCMSVDKRVSTQISYEASHNMHYKPVIANSSVQRIRIWLADNYLGLPMQSKARTFVRLEFVQQAQ
jgi:hypothetical protein